MEFSFLEFFKRCKRLPYFRISSVVESCLTGFSTSIVRCILYFLMLHAEYVPSLRSSTPSVHFPESRVQTACKIHSSKNLVEIILIPTNKILLNPLKKWITHQRRSTFLMNRLLVFHTNKTLLKSKLYLATSKFMFINTVSVSRRAKIVPRTIGTPSQQYKASSRSSRVRTARARYRWSNIEQSLWLGRRLSCSGVPEKSRLISPSLFNDPLNISKGARASAKIFRALFSTAGRARRSAARRKKRGRKIDKKKKIRGTERKTRCL